jgi:hypothetical protein
MSNCLTRIRFIPTPTAHNEQICDHVTLQDAHDIEKHAEDIPRRSYFSKTWEVMDLVESWS